MDNFNKLIYTGAYARQKDIIKGLIAVPILSINGSTEK